MPRDPNKPIETLVPLNPKPRHEDHAESYGPDAEPGYRCTGRRPRVAGITEIVSPDRAERIEKLYEDMEGPEYGEY